MTETIPTEICDLLERTFGDKIDSFGIEIHSGNKSGDGFFGELIFLSMKHKKSYEEYHLVIKQVAPSEKESTKIFLSSFYSTENCFYTRILPTLQKFQKNFPKAPIFDNIPICYGIHTEKGKETLILENLKFKNYEMHPKKAPLSLDMYEKIFALYGKYHALSFAFRELHPEDFSYLVSGLSHNWIALLKTLEESFQEYGKQMQEALKRCNDEEMVCKFQKYADDSVNLAIKALQCNSPHSVFLHGDSWCNNMMFKYDTFRNIEDIKLIDFQMVYNGSPVLDLSYCLYSGADEESLNNFDRLLETYHRSLTENMKQYNLDARKLYPMEVLKEEWKIFCPFGFVAGYLIWDAKNIEEEDIEKFNEVLDGKAEIKSRTLNDNFNDIMYYTIKHLSERGYL